MIIKNYSWEEGLAGIIKGEECEVKGQRCRGQLWEKTIDVSGKEKETAQGQGVAQKRNGSISGPWGEKEKGGEELC